MRVRQQARFVMTAVITLAIGITTVITMFSVFATVVLTPVHVPDPDTLVSLYATNPGVNFVPPTLSWQRFEAIRRGTTALTQVAAYTTESVAVSRSGALPEQIRSLRVSSEFFGAIGAVPWQGRFFSAEDDLPNGPAVCVLSYELWQSTYGGESLVGRMITLDGRPHEVIGILRPHLTAPWGDRHIFLPRVFEDSSVTAKGVETGASFVVVIGRRRPGVTLQQVTEEMRALSQAYARDFAGRSDAANTIDAQPITDAVVGTRRPMFSLLLGAVTLVLLVSCANTGALLLGRVVSRQRDVALKQALGASRVTIIRELLFEALALASIAAVVGVLASAAALPVLQSRLGSSLPPGVTLELSASALIVTVAVALFTAAAVGVVPAILITRSASQPLAVSFTRGMSTDPLTRRLRAALVVGEVAFSVCLLVAATLLTGSLIALQRTSPGFDPHGVAAGFVTLPADPYATPERQTQFVDAVLDRLRANPRIEDAAVVVGLPFHDENFASTYAIAGRPIPPVTDRSRAGLRIVTASYFHLMRIRLVHGRTFTEADRAGSPRVCIVNESLARRQFGRDSPLGHMLLRGVNADQAFQIVGVVEDVHTNGIRSVVPDEVFYPFPQLPRPALAIVVRTAGHPDELAPAVAAAVAAVNPALAVARFAPMDRRLAETLGPDRNLATLSGAFALIAILLTSVGLYAVLAHSVASRTVEIGIRMALGAARPAILRMVVSQGMRLAALGIVLGLAGAAASSTLLDSQLFGVAPYEIAVYAGAAIMFAAVCAIAAFIPAWRATRVSPVVALASVDAGR